MTAEVPDPQGLGDAPLSSVSDDSMTHPSFDTSASLLQQDQQEQQMQHSNEPSDAASHMSASLPLTPQTQRTSDKQGELDERGASSSPPSFALSTHSAPTPRRGRRVRYVRSREPPNTPPAPLTSTYSSRLQREQVDRIVAMCHDVSMGRIKRMAPVHAETTRAIATKERVCMELREELAREEAQLEELRSAWKRMTQRIGSHAPSPRLPPQLRHSTPSQTQSRRRSMAHSPSHQPSPASGTPTRSHMPPAHEAMRESSGPSTDHPPSRTTSVSAPQAEASLLASSSTSGPDTSFKSSDSAWSDLRRIPTHLSNQLHAVMDQLSLTADEDTSLASSPSHDRTQRAGANLKLDTTAGAAEAAASPRMSLSSLPQSLDELSSDMLRDKLSSGWHVLSQRLRDTTASLKDISAWVPEDMPPLTSRSSRASLPVSMDENAFSGLTSNLESMSMSPLKSDSRRASTMTTIPPVTSPRQNKIPLPSETQRNLAAQHKASLARLSSTTSSPQRSARSSHEKSLPSLPPEGQSEQAPQVMYGHAYDSDLGLQNIPQNQPPHPLE